VLVNPPGVADPRANELANLSVGNADIPVVLASHEAGDRLLRALDPERRSLLDLRKLADAGATEIALDGDVELALEVEKKALVAYNVGALLPGKGALAGEMIVIGAHLDHLGMGEFGSRSGPGKLHPGADDNASGTAAILMLAESMNRAYAALPPEQPARTVAFIAFSAEESGLNGARHYVENPIWALDKHALMINFDMIGRITKKRLAVYGVNSAQGMSEWLEPMFEQSGLEVAKPETMLAASDHAAFYAKRVPVLFGIIADFHNDYHTPADVSDKINQVDAVRAVNLFHDVGMVAATRTEPFVFQTARRRAAPPSPPAEPAAAERKPPQEGKGGR
jgi:Zn-dependent M28 family amino/carboxypeptidase